VKKFFCVLLLVGLMLAFMAPVASVPAVYAQADQPAAGDPAAEEPLPLDGYLAQFFGLAGVGGLVALAVNVGKSAGWIKDGQAPTYKTIINLVLFVAFVVLRIFKPDVDMAGLDGNAATLAEIGMLALGFVVQNFGSLAGHKSVRGAALIGKSYSAQG